MHMADALLTPAVAGVMYAASAVVAGASIVELHKEEKQDLTSAAKKLPTMAVMSALVFAGQMINYTIPGTGSSGHLCGGLLLTSVLGPWAGFLSMIVILTIQSLFFADGGLMALGANVWNLAFYGCIEEQQHRCGCVLTLQLGAFSVVLETTLSGITDLPFGAFCAIMQPIHLAIGLIEGLITAAVLLFLYEARPELLRQTSPIAMPMSRYKIVHAMGNPRRNAAAAWLSAPYLLWLLFAAYLNLGIWLLNQ